MKRFSICLIVLLPLLHAGLSTFAQSRFQAAYGAAGPDEPKGLTPAADGGIVVGGYSTAFGGGAEIVVMKTMPDGSLDWFHTIGDAGADFAWSVDAGPSGGYLLGGWTQSFGLADDNFLLMAVDAAGLVSWSAVASSTLIDRSLAAIQTSSGAVMGGFSNGFGSGLNDGALISVDAGSGALQWATVYGGTGNDAFESLTLSGSILLAAGNSSSPPAVGTTDLFFVAVDAATGDTLWTAFLGTNGGQAAVQALAPVSGGGFIAAGRIDGIGAGLRDIVLCRLDINGNFLWAKTYGTVGFENAWGVVEAPDGGFVVSGESDGPGVVAGIPPRLIAFKTDANGTLLSTMDYGVDLSMQAVDLVGFADGGVGIAAKFINGPAGGNDFYLARTNADLETGCFEADFNLVSAELPLTLNRGLIAVDFTPDFVNPTFTATPQTVLFDTVYCAEVLPSGLASGPYAEQVDVYPNPSDLHATLETASPHAKGILRLYDITGREHAVLPARSDAGGRVQLPTEALPDGLYVVVFEQNGPAPARYTARIAVRH